MKIIVTLTTVSLLFSTSAFAEEEDASLSTQLANPLAAMISLPTQINYDDDLGLNGEGSITQINVQPVLPFQVSENWNLITRTIFPLVRQDNLTRLNATDSGLGDIMASAFFSPIQPGESGWIWGAGPALLLPTATNDAIGSDQWAAGPTFVALKQTGPWTSGILANHLWTVSGEEEFDPGNAEIPVVINPGRGAVLSSSSSSNKINASYIEPWVSFATQRGTTLSMSTEASYDWNSSTWLIPVVLTADHLFDKSAIPFSVGVAARYWAESPDVIGPSGWALRLQFTLLFIK
jgi:hypothetical protein